MHECAQRFCQTNPRLGVWREGAGKGLGVYLQKEEDRVRLRTCSKEELNQHHVAKSQPAMEGQLRRWVTVTQKTMTYPCRPEELQSPRAHRGKFLLHYVARTGAGSLASSIEQYWYWRPLWETDFLCDGQGSVWTAQ